jgi:hypothetical protein
MCQVGTFATPPACDDAAKAYVRGAAPAKKFMLVVQGQHNKVRQCGGIYSPSGVLESTVGSTP